MNKEEEAKVEGDRNSSIRSKGGNRLRERGVGGQIFVQTERGERTMRGGTK